MRYKPASLLLILAACVSQSSGGSGVVENKKYVPAVISVTPGYWAQGVITCPIDPNFATLEARWGDAYIHPDGCIHFPDFWVTGHVFEETERWLLITHDFHRDEKHEVSVPVHVWRDCQKGQFYDAEARQCPPEVTEPPTSLPTHR